MQFIWQVGREEGTFVLNGPSGVGAHETTIASSSSLRKPPHYFYAAFCVPKGQPDKTTIGKHEGKASPAIKISYIIDALPR